MDVELYGTNYRVVSDEDAAKMRAEEEKRARAAWAERFEVARATIPPHFAWIRPAVNKQWDLWRERLPWIAGEHVNRFRAMWRDRTNLLICGPPDVGKTCLLVLHAVWTLAEAGYDAPAIVSAREKCTQWEREPPKRTLVGKMRDGSEVYQMRRPDAPAPPESLQVAREARGLRFVTAPDLLDERQQGPNEQRLSAALAASALYIDEVGRELYGAKGEGHLASGRRAVMMRVLESRWANERRFAATTEHTIEELGNMYGGGSFRRIAGERSGATVLDLGDDQWAGVWLRQQGKGQRR